MRNIRGGDHLPPNPPHRVSDPGHMSEDLHHSYVRRTMPWWAVAYVIVLAGVGVIGVIDDLNEGILYLLCRCLVARASCSRDRQACGTHADSFNGVHHHVLEGRSSQNEVGPELRFTEGFLDSHGRRCRHFAR